MKLINKVDNLLLPTIKNHLVVSHDLDDELIALYASASLAYAEAYTFRDLVPSTYQDTYQATILSPYEPDEIKDEEDNIIPFVYQDGIICLDLEKLQEDGFDLELDIFILYDIYIDAMVQAARLLYIGSAYAQRENETYIPRTVSIGTNKLLDLVQGSNIL